MELAQLRHSFFQAVYIEVLLRTMRIAASVTLCSLLLATRWPITCLSTPVPAKSCSTNSSSCRCG